MTNQEVEVYLKDPSIKHYFKKDREEIENLLKDPSVKHYFITKEESFDSLKYYNPKNHNILDLGFGRWGVTDINSFTPIFAMNRGANCVVGVDIAKGEVDYFTNYFNTHYPNTNSKFYHGGINDPNQVRTLIEYHDITFIKSDIERYEVPTFQHFIKEDLTNVDTFIMEYHTLGIRDLFVNKFIEWGYKITAHGETYPKMVNFRGIGALYGEKIK
jgi:hypothetical protein